MNARLDLPRRVVNGLLAEAQRHPETEVCGFVVRDAGGCSLRPVRNVAANPARRFEMDPAGMVDAFRRAREDGEELIAIYHSHPTGPAEPSATDRELAYYPEFAYLIVSLGTRGVLELRAYRLEGGAFREVELMLEEAPAFC